MTQRYHANAVTNVHIRVKLQNNSFQKTQKELATEFNISPQTLSK